MQTSSTSNQTSAAASADVAARNLMQAVEDKAVVIAKIVNQQAALNQPTSASASTQTPKALEKAMDAAKKEYKKAIGDLRDFANKNAAAINADVAVKVDIALNVHAQLQKNPHADLRTLYINHLNELRGDTPKTQATKQALQLEVFGTTETALLRQTQQLERSLKQAQKANDSAAIKDLNQQLGKVDAERRVVAFVVTDQDRFEQRMTVVQARRLKEPENSMEAVRATAEANHLAALHREMQLRNLGATVATTLQLRALTHHDLSHGQDTNFLAYLTSKLGPQYQVATIHSGNNQIFSVQSAEGTVVVKLGQLNADFVAQDAHFLGSRDHVTDRQRYGQVYAHMILTAGPNADNTNAYSLEVSEFISHPTLQKKYDTLAKAGETELDKCDRRMNQIQVERNLIHANYKIEKDMPTRVKNNLNTLNSEYQQLEQQRQQIAATPLAPENQQVVQKARAQHQSELVKDATRILDFVVNNKNDGVLYMDLKAGNLFQKPSGELMSADVKTYVNINKHTLTNKDIETTFLADAGKPKAGGIDADFVAKQNAGFAILDLMTLSADGKSSGNLVQAISNYNHAAATGIKKEAYPEYLERVLQDPQYQNANQELIQLCKDLLSDKVSLEDALQRAQTIQLNPSRAAVAKSSPDDDNSISSPRSETSSNGLTQFQQEIYDPAVAQRDACRELRQMLSSVVGKSEAECELTFRSMLDFANKNLNIDTNIPSESEINNRILSTVVQLAKGKMSIAEGEASLIVTEQKAVDRVTQLDATFQAPGGNTPTATYEGLRDRAQAKKAQINAGLDAPESVKSDKDAPTNTRR